jgi:WD40 repeat protein
VLLDHPESKEPVLTITDHGHEGRITGAYWMPLNKAIMTTGGDGTIKLFDAQVRSQSRLLSLSLGQ